MKKYIFISLLCTNIFAEPLPIIYQYYINGINTTPDEARNNQVKINQYLNYKNYTKGNYISKDIGLLYNEKPSPIEAGIFKQILDSIRQKTQEFKKLTVEEIVDNVMEVYGFIYPKDSEDYKNLTISVQKHIDELYSPVGFNFDKIIEDFEMRSNITNIKTLNEEYFILIAHSQGNLYANEMINYYNAKTDNKEHFALLSIASPASVVNGYKWNTYQQYVTSYCDIINKVPGALPYNQWQNMRNPDDENCHSLIDTYFYDDNLRNLIINKYKDLILNYTEYVILQKSTLRQTNPQYNFIENPENHPYYEFTVDVYDTINNITRSETTRVNFLSYDREYKVFSLVSIDQPMPMGEIRTTHEIINHAYPWKCVGTYDSVTDTMIWNHKCVQCMESSSFMLTGITGGCSDVPIFYSSRKSTAGDGLVLSGTIPNNSSILTNKIFLKQ